MGRAPVLLIIFNRPDETARVYESIRRAQPTRLYVAADGPRPDMDNDRARCESTRELIKPDWPCTSKLLFRDENLGCGLAVSSAIDWFFKHEEEGIILEDDCVPVDTFFPFCDELLERYRNDEKIAQISGSNFVGDQFAGEASYFFSNYPDVWGWATWRRSWLNNDFKLLNWVNERRNVQIGKILSGGLIADMYWKKNIDAVAAGKIDTWDYQWLYSIWKRQALTIVPRVSQVDNIGHAPTATHTAHPPPSFLTQAECLSFPLVHSAASSTANADRAISLRRYDITIKGFVFSYLRRVKRFTTEFLKRNT